MHNEMSGIGGIEYPTFAVHLSSKWSFKLAGASRALSFAVALCDKCKPCHAGTTTCYSTVVSSSWFCRGGSLNFETVLYCLLSHDDLTVARRWTAAARVPAFAPHGLSSHSPGFNLCGSSLTRARCRFS